MPLPTNNSRPAIPYNPAQVLPNHNRYGALGNFPPTAQQLDGDFNAVIDLVNNLAGAVNNTAAGVFPGADNALNTNKLPTTDGQGNVSWTSIMPFHVSDNALQTQHIQNAAITSPKIQVQAVGTAQLADGAITTPKMGDSAVTTAKLADNAVTTAKLLDGNVTTPKMADNTVIAQKIADNAVTPTKIIDNAVTTQKIINNAVTTPKIADNAVTTQKIPDAAITVPKISSVNAAAGHVLTANGAGAASFVANGGKVLQIVSYEDRKFFRNEYEAAATPQNLFSFKTAPFLLRITPRKANSKILVFYSINVGGYQNQYISVTLCKNNAPFKVGVDDAPASYWGTTHSAYSALGRNYGGGQYGCYNFSSLFIDTGPLGVQITYEIKKAHPYTCLNAGYNGGFTAVSTMHAIEIDL
jgi:hypothetical protein